MAKTETDSRMNEIFLSPAPHVFAPATTQTYMWNVVIALAPIAVYSVYLYSGAALYRIIISVLFTMAFETGFRLILKRDVRIKDGSAFITGLLLALVMPPTIPIWILILSSFFAIVVGKEFFGGLGQNPFNPALIGRAFAFVSFAGPMTTWISTNHKLWHGAITAKLQATTVDVFGTATPLNYINPVDGVASKATEIAKMMGLNSTNELYWNLFLGKHSGCIGETPIFLILLGFIFLVFTKTIDWKIPVAMMSTATLISWVLGVDPLLTLFSGGLVFGAVFMATDYVTTPVTPRGRLIFGIGCGLLTAIIRNFSSNPEGVMFSILIMNALVPFLDKLLPRKYGFIKRRLKK